MFIRSAVDVAGDKERFRCRLEFLKDSYDMLKTEFSFEELNEYLAKYIAAGCPMVSHSEIYRQAYKPAYRVVKVDRIRELCR